MEKPIQPTSFSSNMWAGALGLSCEGTTLEAPRARSRRSSRGDSGRSSAARSGGAPVARARRITPGGVWERAHGGAATVVLGAIVSGMEQAARHLGRAVSGEEPAAFT